MAQAEKAVLLELKANLFDLHNQFTKKRSRITQMIEATHQVLLNVLAVDLACMYIDAQSLARLVPNHTSFIREGLVRTEAAALKELEEVLSDKPYGLTQELSIRFDDQSYASYLLINLTSAIHEPSFYLFAFEGELDWQEETIQDFVSIIHQHYRVICYYFQEKYLRERDRLLIQLSTNLHSIYDTLDVLRRVYHYVNLLYPNFSYRFLMSHELNDTSLPIYTIEYFHHGEDPWTRAFMNNKIQIEQDKFHDRTIIYSPLSGRQGVYGVFEITIPMHVILNDTDLHFIQQAAKMIGRAVERTTLYQSSNQLVSDLQLINVASRDLNRNLERSEISESVKKHIVDSCQAEEIAIVLIPSNGAGDQPYMVTEESTAYFKQDRANRFVHYLYQELEKNAEPILSGNFNREGLIVPFNSVIVIPMWDSERMFGFIVIAHAKPYYFSFDKYKFIQSFVQHAALAYMNSMLKEKLRQTAITDYLTKLYMRNYLDKQIEQHMQDGQGGALMLLDVDDFKMINDTYGHYVGDKVLIQIANVLQETLHDNEIAARWGGEEFAVYIPYYNLSYAQEVALQIREKIKQQTDPKVTVSIGISTWSAMENSIEELFIKADEALYEAKLTGKNKVVVN